MKVRYKIYYIFLVILTIAVFTGLYKVLEVKNTEISEIEDVVSEYTDLSAMNKYDGTDLRKLYNINKHDVKDFIYYAPKSNMDADEVLIIKTKSDSDVKDIEEKINNRIKKQSDSFQNYDKEQYEVLKNHILEEKSGYIILIISKDSKSIKEAVNRIV